jgi:hypothetical protein
MRNDEVRIEDRPDASEWGVDEPTMARWHELKQGTTIEIVKRSAKHGGEEQARYPATVIGSSLPAPWVVLETHWTMGRHDQGLLVFENGDTLHEIFSPVHPYNAFAVYTPAGELKGWYANVDWPAVLETEGDERILVWNDLYLDVVAVSDGRVEVLDEDELEESGLADSNPDLHARILTARDELLARFRDRRPPFNGTEVDTAP